MCYRIMIYMLSTSVICARAVCSLVSCELMRMCVCACVCAYVCVSVPIYVPMYAYTYTYTFACACASACSCSYICAMYMCVNQRPSLHLTPNPSCTDSCAGSPSFCNGRNGRNDNHPLL